MSSAPSRHESDDFEADWGTDALTGLIAPRAPQPAVAPGPTPPALPLPAARPLPPPPIAPPVAAVGGTASGASRARWWSYASLGLLALVAGAVLARRAVSEPTPRAQSLGGVIPSSSASVQGLPVSLRLEVRAVTDPTPKAAASAFARGDYRAALGQYRALARQYPQETAYQALVRVLERRLLANAPSQ